MGAARLARATLCKQSATNLRRNRQFRPEPSGHARRLGFQSRESAVTKGSHRMAATNINRVILTGNLTRDPELRSTPGGMSVCSLRIASNTRRKDNTTGEWVDKPNYFSVTVWGAQGENCARFLSKGRPVAIDGRLEWREWQGNDGAPRGAIRNGAAPGPFPGGPDRPAPPPAGGAAGRPAGNGFAPRSDVPADTSDFAPPQPVGGRGGDVADDDIPF